jgi:hypothetical protein
MDYRRKVFSMTQVFQALAARDWRALLLYNGRLEHDRGLTTLEVRFLTLPGKIARLLEGGGVCSLASALDAHYVTAETRTIEGRTWNVLRVAFLISLETLRREQQSARSKSWSNRKPRRPVQVASRL